MRNCTKSIDNMGLQLVQQAALTLAGSAKMVAEFFNYGVNNILYQRGIYDPSQFGQVKKYGMPLFVTKDAALQTYLSSVMQQMESWITEGQIRKLVLVITGVDSEEVLERWQFNVVTDNNSVEQGGSDKEEKEIQKEIAALLRQITSSVSFLPMLDETCTFDLLLYTASDLQTPVQWEESDPKYIANYEEVRLRSFDTKVHKVDASVTYKVDGDELHSDTNLC